MAFDQAQSPRLGQRTPIESTSVRMFAGSEIPEAAWHGQLIYRTDTKILQVYDAFAGPTHQGAWSEVAGGVAGQLTFIGPEPPTANGVGDTWYDTDDGYRLYVWDGTEWVLTSIDNTQISGELTDDQLGQLSISKLLAGTLSATLILGSDITTRTADAGPGVSIDNVNGIIIHDANGDEIITLPIDGSGAQFTGSVTTDQLSTINGASLRGIIQMAKGGVLTLNQGTTAPVSPPILTVDWPYVTVTKPTFATDEMSLKFNPVACRGMAWDATNNRWLTVQEGTRIGSLWGWRVWAISPTGVTSWVKDFKYAINATVLGIAVVGSDYYLGVELAPGDMLFIARGSGGSSPTFNYSASGWMWCGIGTSNNRSSIGIIESHLSNQDLRVHHITPGTWAETGQVTLNTPTRGDIPGGNLPCGVYGGTMDYGATRYVAAVEGSATEYTLWNSTGTEQVNEVFPVAVTTTIPVRGFDWDGTYIWELTDDSRLYQHTPIKWTTEDAKWWVGLTYRDTDTTAGSLTHQTDMGKPVGKTMKRRARFTVTFPATIPDFGDADDPDSLGIYLGRLNGATAPALTAMYANPPTPSPGSGVTTWQFTTAPQFSADATHPNPPAAGANNFPLASPAQLIAQSGGWTVNGQSNGTVGTGTLRDSMVTAAWNPAVAAAAQPYLERNRDTDSGNYTSGDWVIVNFNNSVNNVGFTASGGQYTVPKTGRYVISASVNWASNSTGRRDIRIVANGTVPPTSGNTLAYGREVANPSVGTINNLTWAGRLVAGWTVQVDGFTNHSSGSVFVQGAPADGTVLGISYLGP